MDDKLQEIRLNMERMNESIASLKLEEDRNSKLLLGDKGMDFVGLMERMRDVEDALKNFERQKNMLKGVLWGLGAQGVGIIAILRELYL